MKSASLIQLDLDFESYPAELVHHSHSIERYLERKIEKWEAIFVAKHGIRLPHESGSIVRFFRYVDIPHGYAEDKNLLDLVGLSVVLIRGEACIKTAYFCDRPCQHKFKSSCSCWGAFRNKRPLLAAHN